MLAPSPAQRPASPDDQPQTEGQAGRGSERWPHPPGHCAQAPSPVPTLGAPRVTQAQRLREGPWGPEAGQQPAGRLAWRPQSCQSRRGWAPSAPDWTPAGTVAQWAESAQPQERQRVGQAGHLIPRGPRPSLPTAHGASWLPLPCQGTLVPPDGPWGTWTLPSWGALAPSGPDPTPATSGRALALSLLTPTPFPPKPLLDTAAWHQPGPWASSPGPTPVPGREACGSPTWFRSTGSATALWTSVPSDSHGLP